MLEVRRMRVLREVAQRGSFSAAAEALSFTQSAVSQQIAALEREKTLVLRSIKELEFDNAMGKLSPKDFEEMGSRLRARAMMLMKQLDEGSSGYRPLIERELSARLATRSVARLKTTDTVRPKPDARVSAPLSWDELPSCDPADFTLATMPSRFARMGDRHAEIDHHVGSLASLLELSARQTREGLGDAPWPPHYRKQKGEPARVQPSRRRQRDVTNAVPTRRRPSRARKAR